MACILIKYLTNFLVDDLSVVSVHTLLIPNLRSIIFSTTLL